MPLVEALKFLVFPFLTTFGAISVVTGFVFSFALTLMVARRPAAFIFWFVSVVFNLPAVVLLNRLTANPNTEFLLVFWPLLLVVPFGIGWLAGGLFGLMSRIALIRIMERPL